MIEALIAVAGIALLCLLVWRRSRRPLIPESLFKVLLTSDHISCTEPNGNQRSIPWADVASVRIHTNDSGPWGTDVLWGFHRASGEVSLVVPGGATGEQEMLVELSKLPGWRDNEVIAAMGCTSNREFICWEREGSART
jgi:hypothetical protein